MKTVKHDSPGYFPTPPGTCLIKPDLPMADGCPAPGKNWHPFIVISEKDDAVECVMGRTLTDARTGKDRSWKLGKIQGAVEIMDPCPPMDFKDRRRQYVDVSQVMVIPKAVLYASTNVEICNFRGNCLSAEQTKILAHEARMHASDRFASYSDPFDYENKDYPIDAFLPKGRDLPSGGAETAVRRLPDGPDFLS